MKTGKKKLWLSIVLISSLLVLSGVTACDNGTAGGSHVSSPAGESDFNLIFKYGFSGRNTLDTYQGTYTKDMVADSPVTIPLSLNQEDKDKIYQKMVEIGFFDYPDKFAVIVPPGELESRALPYSTYFFRVTYQGQTKELLWHEKVTNSEAKADKLRELIGLIRSIIESNEAYKKLPEPKSAYM
jgi:hypothetical protein